jgi:hypothetical protein
MEKQIHHHRILLPLAWSKVAITHANSENALIKIEKWRKQR